MAFAVGTSFKSYAELQQAIDEYSSLNNVTIIKQDSKTVATYQKRVPNRTINSELVYGSIKYGCVHSGSYRCKETTTGARPKQRTEKKIVHSIYSLNVR